jgi:hypothetical protein
MKTLTELTTDANLTSWIPADYYADLILEASVCYGQLSGVITAIDYDVAQGTGGIVQVRSVPARTAQGPMAACSCLSAPSSTLTTYSITIQPYGDYDEMCAYSLWKANGPVKDRILNEMAKGLAHARDVAIWAAITALGVPPTYHAHSTVSCTSTATDSGCCGSQYGKSFYNAVIEVTQAMKAAAYHPDYLILNPTVARYFYNKDYLYENGFQTKYDANGNMTMLHGLKVIESCCATACATTSKGTMAVIIDSSRAVGEAWGMRPKFEEERIAYCDKYRETIWMYWGCNDLDLGAIGHVLNP